MVSYTNYVIAVVAMVAIYICFFFLALLPLGLMVAMTITYFFAIFIALVMLLNLFIVSRGVKKHGRTRVPGLAGLSGSEIEADPSDEPDGDRMAREL
jgi:amino acid transporter